MGVVRPRTSARAVIGAVLVCLVAATGCDTDAPSAGAPPNAPAQVSATPPATPSSVSTAGASDFCALAIRIATDSGIMVDKHYISPLKETLDQLKALVNASLAAKDQLVTGLPPDVRSALLVELQYFQALKDHDFSQSTPVPEGLNAAVNTVNQYQIAACGVTFDR